MLFNIFFIPVVENERSILKTIFFRRNITRPFFSTVSSGLMATEGEKLTNIIKYVLMQTFPNANTAKMMEFDGFS